MYRHNYSLDLGYAPLITINATLLFLKRYLLLDILFRAQPDPYLGYGLHVIMYCQTLRRIIHKVECRKSKK